ncbi:MAG: glycoside hydrolase family 32 protein [Aggregatilineales bacterium]
MTTHITGATNKKFDADPARPRFHYLPPSNWMNDPNGLIQWNGAYHLFYQYNPDGAFHANMHWGHAVSRDLVHWEQLPIALAPTPGSVDEDGIFSGCAVNNDGQPVIIYTGVRGERFEHQVQCVAFGSDDLLKWEKYANNPVVGEVPPEANQTADFRDPFVWRDGEHWYMLVGSGIKDVGGTAFLYRSDDLLSWDYLNPLLVGDRTKNGLIWECPNFFPLGDKWVLIVSMHDGKDTVRVQYFVGTYENHRFTPEVEGLLDHAYLYAPLTMQDDSGRRILWGWLREGRSKQAHTNAGWAGAQSIPRELSLDEHSRLIMRPVPEIETIRGAHHQYDNLNLDTTSEAEMPISAHGLALDIALDATLQDEGELMLSVACSPDNSQRTDIQFSALTGELSVNRAYSSLSEDDERHSHTAPHELDAGENLHLRIILDGSLLEIIANGRTSITSRIYPTRFEDDGIRLQGTGALVNRLDIYEMPSIWR